MNYRNVVTSFLQYEELILLLRRSNRVSTYQGKWAGVSGFLEEGENPLERAKTEIKEEVCLSSLEVELVRSGKPLRIYDEQEETIWIVHPFLFTVTSQRVSTDWEHSDHIWVNPSNIAAFETVPKLKQAFDRVRWDLDSIPQNLVEAVQIVQEIAQDRFNGASYLGRRALSAIQAAAQLSIAQSSNAFFKDILIVTARLREAQPSMATIVNLTGRLLYALDSVRDSTYITDLRQMTINLAKKSISQSELAVEQVARNGRSSILGKRSILTHSYSSTVKRTLQLCKGQSMTIFVTESASGFEGRALARDLVDSGLTVHVLPDTATRRIPQDIDSVIVGADGVLADGSVINKTGTRDIALTAHTLGIPLYVLAETTKLNTMQFLGQLLQLTNLFDVTPSEHVSCLITELGEMKPSDMEMQVRNMVRELYT